MRRLFRILVRFATAGSVVLFALAIALWLRSYCVRDRIDLLHLPKAPSRIDTSDPDLPLPMSQYDEMYLGTFPGRVDVGHLDYESPYPAAAPPTASFALSWEKGAVIWDIDQIDRYTVSRLGFGVDWGTHDGLISAPRHVHGVRIPLWFIALAAGLLPAVQLHQFIRRRRWVNFGVRCAACGYDLRATPERCPECGKVPVGAPNETPVGAGAGRRRDGI